MKARLAFVVSVLLLFVLATTAFADDFTVVSYDDMGEIAVGDIVEEYWFPAEVGNAPFLVTNGDFSLWQDGMPVGWTTWNDGAKAGWEQPHLAQTNLALGGDGMNYALSYFVRNVGGSGSYYVGAYQPLTAIQSEGHYWVTVHATMFGMFDYFELNNVYYARDPYNSMAWYAISDSADPALVTEWRELFPSGALPGFTAVPNDWGVAIYAGRYETMHIMPGQYLHLKAGHKFPAYNDWTTFVFDDISIVPAGGEVIADGFWMDGFVGWDPAAAR